MPPWRARSPGTTRRRLPGGLGRKASDGELYIAHVLGPAGAVKLTTLAVTNPGAAADAAFPAAADANRSIFYDRQGRPRSVLDVYGVLVGRYDGARNPAAASFDRAANETAHPWMRPRPLRCLPARRS